MACARRIAGNAKIVYAGVDTDGTDGPGGLHMAGAPSCLAGAIVDGYTLEELRGRGYLLENCLQNHETSEALWNTGNGIYATQSVSLNDLLVVLIAP